MLSYWTRLQPLELASWTGWLFFFRIILVMNELYINCTHYCFAMTLNCTYSVHKLYMDCTIISKNIARASFKNLRSQLVQFMYGSCTVHVQFMYSSFIVIGIVQFVCCVVVDHL